MKKILRGAVEPVRSAPRDPCPGVNHPLGAIPQGRFAPGRGRGRAASARAPGQEPARGPDGSAAAPLPARTAVGFVSRSGLLHDRPLPELSGPSPKSAVFGQHSLASLLLLLHNWPWLSRCGRNPQLTKMFAARRGPEESVWKVRRRVFSGDRLPVTHGDGVRAGWAGGAGHPRDWACLGVRTCPRADESDRSGAEDVDRGEGFPSPAAGLGRTPPANPGPPHRASARPLR
jgi:hypothetical protein